MAWTKWLAVLCFSLLAACGDDLGDDSPADAGPTDLTDDAGPIQTACETNEECPFGYVCSEGLCRADEPEPVDTGCFEDSDCPEDHVCAISTGRCVAEADLPSMPSIDTSSCTSGRTRPCGTKLGACEYGTEECVDGAWTGECVGGTRPVEELCNDIDDDCNGVVDDGYVTGAACSAGQGECAQSGVTVCSATGTSTSCSVAGLDPAGRVELCGDNLDNNCDGQVDEGFVVNVSCSEGVGACARDGVSRCSSDGLSLECSAMAGTPGATELCGGSPDDNCNGQQEEGYEDLGDICTAGAGACLRTGTIVCTGNQLGTRCSAVAGTPAPQELCGNNIDDNCDGSVNEGFELLGQPCTVGTAPCQTTGTWVCGSSGAQLECDLPPAQNEVCNGADDDGDSCTDEGFDVGAACTVGTGVCARSGFKVCAANGSGTVCDATAGSPNPNGELCGNNLDDDCNGQVDEGFPTVGTACSNGRGICQRSGSVVCSANGLGVECDAVPGPPNPAGELCGNGLNDDCDTQTDEGFGTGVPCNDGQGICLRSGQTVCTSDGLDVECSASAGPPDPDGELCGNNADDDCNGQVDEGYDDGDACAEGLGICERSGILVCTVDRLATECSAVPGNPNPRGDLCGNNLDDDCNGVPDDGYPELGQACVVGVGICEAPGVYVCDGFDATTCQGTPGTPETEVCDDLDNDCDDVVDNGCDDDFDGYCNENATIVGTPAICTAGVDDCDDSNGAINPAAQDVCDGLDNDCSGAADEGFDGDGDGFTTCDTDPLVFDCDDSNPDAFPGSCERCEDASGNTLACNDVGVAGNGVDEDCDGYIDDGCAPCSTADADGDTVSECEGDCDDNEPAVFPGNPEICDQLDNDCNQGTTQNCDVSDNCDPSPTSPDQCIGGQPCITSNAIVNPQVPDDYFCISYCNASPPNAGLGDGCEADQTCSSNLTPTANLHGCLVDANAGLAPVGTDCTQNSDCRSGNCLDDIRAGATGTYCTDACASDDYCGNGTVCQSWVESAGPFEWTLNSGRCLRVLPTQTRSFGQSCTAPTQCRHGNQTCLFVGVSMFCSQLCCTETDCPTGYHCSLNGPDDGFFNTDVVPVCLPDTGGAHDRPAGAACTSNGECQSQFCDNDLNVCVSVCCNDSDCPTGLACESVGVNRSDGTFTFSRMCLNNPLADGDELEAL